MQREGDVVSDVERGPEAIARNAIEVCERKCSERKFAKFGPEKPTTHSLLWAQCMQFECEYIVNFACPHQN